jgi:hypothetical protein
MSAVQEAFGKIKASIENALSMANPELALKEAEHAFMEVLASAHADLAAAHEALAKRVATLESIATHLEPTTVASDVAGEAESMLHKIENFVNHLIHPGDDASPSSTEPAALPADSLAQPAVAENTGSGAAPVAPSGIAASDSAAQPPAAAGTAPSAGA